MLDLLVDITGFRTSWLKCQWIGGFTGGIHEWISVRMVNRVVGWLVYLIVLLTAW